MCMLPLNTVHITSIITIILATTNILIAITTDITITIID